MAFAIGGNELDMQPTSFRWMPKSAIDYSGHGHPIYPAMREFELRFNTMSYADADEIYTYFLTVSSTGTLVMSLPKFPSSTYTFFDYTGTILQEPEYGADFAENHTEVIVMGITRA